MTLENEVTAGRATWLDVLHYDPAAALVELRAVVHDEPEALARRVTFTGVSEYAEEPFDPALPREPDLLEHLVGIDVHALNQRTWYVLVTDQREATFYADEPPRIELLGAAP